MNSNQLAQFDDEHGELDVASPDGPDAASGPNGFAGELTGATGAGRTINTTAVVLGIIVAAAAVGILSMRWVGSVSAKPLLAGGTPVLADDLPEIIAGMESGAVNPLTVMRDDPKERQVPFDDVQKNPFLIPDVDDVTTENPTTVTERVDPEQIRKDRRMMIEQAASRVVVTSLLTGGSPMAIVDDRALRVGDEVWVEDWNFVIESISAGGATLVYEDPLLRDPVRVLRGIDTDDDRRGAPRNRPSRPRR